MRTRTGATWNRPTYARSQEAGASGERQGAARGPGRGHNGTGVARGSALCAWCGPLDGVRRSHVMCADCRSTLMREATGALAVLVLFFALPLFLACQAESILDDSASDGSHTTIDGSPPKSLCDMTARELAVYQDCRVFRPILGAATVICDDNVHQYCP